MATRTKIEIMYDETPESPRDWDNLGTLYHQEYAFNHVETYHEDGTRLQGTRHEIMRGESVAVEVDLPRSSVDHHDAGGWIYVSRADVLKEYGVLNHDTRAEALACITAESKVYRAYADGQVFWYRTWVETDCLCCGKPEVMDETSCGGFIVTGDESDLQEQIAEHLGINERAALEDAIEHWGNVVYPSVAKGTFEHGGLGT